MTYRAAGNDTAVPFFAELFIYDGDVVMTDRELRKLRRGDLLEILVEQSREIDRLQQELDRAKLRESDRRLALEKAGTMAEAAMQLNRIFEDADRAAQLYIENIAQLSGRQEEICRRMEEQSRERCLQMEEETRERCRRILEQAQMVCSGSHEHGEAAHSWQDLQTQLDGLKEELQLEEKGKA